MSNEIITINHHALISVHSDKHPETMTLTDWANLYFIIHVAGRSINTIDAKKRDLGLFITFFKETLGTQNPQLWTPSITRSFQNALLSEPLKSTSKPYKPTSVHRIMSNVKHFCGWLLKHTIFPAGNPFYNVKIIELEEPTWNGLSDTQITRLRAACDQRLAACKKANQNPLLELTVFYILLNTGLRESELVALNYGQYHHRGFHDVIRSKSKKVSRKIPLPQEAKEYLDKYLMTKNDLEHNAPLLTNRYGNRISRFDIIKICRRLAQLANAYLPESEKFTLTPHMLRHSFLKRIADKYDVHVAQKMSGNVSIREIFRYTQPSDAEILNYAELLFDA